MLLKAKTNIYNKYSLYLKTNYYFSFFFENYLTTSKFIFMKLKKNCKYSFI